MHRRRRIYPNEPFLEPPDVRYSVHYPLLAVNGSAMELAVQQTIDKRFTLDRLMTCYMGRYHFPAYDRCILFPSARYSSANLPPVLPATSSKERRRRRSGDTPLDWMPPLTPRYPDEDAPSAAHDCRGETLAKRPRPRKSEAFYPHA